MIFAKISLQIQTQAALSHLSFAQVPSPYSGTPQAVGTAHFSGTIQTHPFRARHEPGNSPSISMKHRVWANKPSGVPAGPAQVLQHSAPNSREVKRAGHRDNLIVPAWISLTSNPAHSLQPARLSWLLRTPQALCAILPAVQITVLDMPLLKCRGRWGLALSCA